MKASLFFCLSLTKMYKKVVLYFSFWALLILLINQKVSCQNYYSKDSALLGKSRNTVCGVQFGGHTQYIGTSVFVLTSLIPNINAYYYEIDYGHKLSDKSNLLIDFLIQKSVAPMSIGFSGDTTKYPGHVTSCGFVFGYQRYLWKKLFVIPLINPLIVNYYDKDNKKITSGFMLMLCGRLGYHFDFNLFRQPFYFEVGGEINYWPINTNEPQDFKEIENKFNNFVFSPALNIGYKF